MNKRGFTLIELLAVIVILAIIALIAVPIVINIIDDSKKNATLRSAEMYMDAVEMSIANRTMKHGAIPNDAYQIMSDGNICLSVYNKEKQECGVESKDDINNKNVLKVEVKGEKPTSGQIIIKDGQIEKEYNAPEKTWLEISGKRIEPIEENGEVKFGIVGSNNSKEETIEVGKMSICNPLNVQTEGTYTPGDKYECDVDPNKDGYDYTFYVLNATSTEVNLIMDRNICSDGTPETSSNKCLVEWIDVKKYYADVGGVIPDERLNDGSMCQIGGFCVYNDKGPLTAMEQLTQATSTWENIDNLDIEYDDEGGNFSKFAVNGKTRLPYKKEISNLNENNGYLYENGDYWSFASDYLYYAWSVNSNTSALSATIVDSKKGVRPVINLKI